MKWIAALFLLAPLSACTYQGTCGEPVTTGDADGALTTVASVARAANLPNTDGSRAVTAWPAHLPNAIWLEVRGDDAASSDPRCIGPCVLFIPESFPTVYLRWSIPSGAGDYQLADLGAEICENSADESDDAVWTCAPLAGQLHVNAFAWPCDDHSCGHFDADLVLDAPPNPPPTSAYAFGTSHLLYDESIHSWKCTQGGLGTVPSGGL